MKCNLKRIVLVTVCLLVGMVGWALDYQSFIVNEVGYKILTANTVAVTNEAQYPKKNDWEVDYLYRDIPYSGNIYIPPTVVYDGITYTVTQILENTFKNCTSLTGITISNSVQKIGKDAFMDSNLKTLVINDGSTPLSIENDLVYYYSTTNIEHSPFYGCPIESLHLGRDINHISSSANYAYSPFGTSLKSVETSNLVTSIRPYTFYNCTKLTTVSFGSKIEEIGRYAFYGCSALQAANLGDKVASIGTYAFYGCRAMQSVHISNNVKIIQPYTFYDCEYLKSVTGFFGVESIGENAFYNCNALTSITIPASVQKIDKYAFYSAGLKTLVVNDGSTPLNIVNYLNNGSEYSPFYGCPIESLHLGRDINHTSNSGNYAYKPFGTSLKSVETSNLVTSIRPYTFYNCTNLTTVSFGSKIEEIGRYAFYGCSALQAANLGDKVASIGTYAFYGCRAMQSVHISNNVKIIQPYTFYDCEYLKSVTGFGAVESIGENAFYDCNALTSITIPASVQEIGKYAFYSAGLKTLVINDGSTPLNMVNYLNNGSEYSPFYGCSIDTLHLGRDINHISNSGNYAYKPFGTSLKKVETSNLVTNIRPYTFYNCQSLKLVSLGSNIEEIGTYAFYGCGALASMAIPNSVTTIGEDSFYGTAWYNNQPNGLVYAGKVAYKYKKNNPNDGLPAGTNIIIKDETLGIAAKAFYNCSGLTSVTIPNSVTNIGTFAFSGCTDLTTVTIGCGMTNIAEDAFYGCENITTVTVGMETPVTISDHTFSNRSNATLYVPVGCKAAYEAADYWNEFMEIVEKEPEPEELTPTDISQLDNAIYIDRVEARAGETVTLSVKMKNSFLAEGFGFDLVLPDGIAVAVDEYGDPLAELSTERTNDKITDRFGADFKQDGSLNIQAYSSKGRTISGYDGEVALITIQVSEGMQTAEYPIILKNIAITDENSATMTVDSVTCVFCVLKTPEYIVGDANNDGKINVGDLTAISHYILERPDASFLFQAADANQDGNVNVGDLTAVSHLILWGSIVRPQQAVPQKVSKAESPQAQDPQ